MEKIKNTSPDFKNNAKKIKSGLRKKQAFTLVELIVVITILAILGTIAFISLQGYSRDARDSKRTADLGNIKTSLELFSLKTGNFPSPDSFSTITYSGGTENVWYQGVVGDIVTTNLKSLNEKPLDPLTSAPYTYSVTNSYKEYEILALYEGNVAYNSILNQANAAVSSLSPKIVGNYNGIFVKTTNYIIPVPSIVTSEPLTGGILILNSTNINSQVITNGINIPKNSLTQTSTGNLTINLSVYTGSITKTSGTGAMITAMQQIQGAYTGTTISTNQNIAYILNQTTNYQLIALVNTTILKDSSIEIKIAPSINGICGTDNTLSLSSIPTNLCNTGISSNLIDNGVGTTYTWNCNGINGGTNANPSCLANHIVSTYPGCDTSDITVGAYTISACNIGTNIAGTTWRSWGSIFQWGNNYEFPNNTISNISGSNVLINTIGYGPGNYYYGTNFIYTSTNLVVSGDWGQSQNDNLWGNTGNVIDRKGSCANGYHIPSKLEWDGIIVDGGWGNNGTNMANTLKLPLGGSRYRYDGTPWGKYGYGLYWTTTPNGNRSYYLNIGSNIYTDSSLFSYAGKRSSGNSIRCFKN